MRENHERYTSKIEQIPQPRKKAGAERVDWNALTAAVRETLTTQIYTHVLNKGPLGIISPLDSL